jgi:hypothetical protein
MTAALFLIRVERYLMIPLTQTLRKTRKQETLDSLVIHQLARRRNRYKAPYPLFKARFNMDGRKAASAHLRKVGRPR